MTGDALANARYFQSKIAYREYALLNRTWVSIMLRILHRPRRRFDTARLFCALSLLTICAPGLQAQGNQDQGNQELDAYTVRLTGLWVYSQPFGAFHGTGSQGRFDFQGDAEFNPYNSGAGRFEWKFTRKNHLFVGVLPLNQSRDVVLPRTLVFQGQTYEAGLAASVRLQNYFITPGYQYDIIRRRQGHLGIVAQLDLMYIKGSVNAAAQTLNGTLHAAQASSGTLRAPLPVFGPDFRYYLIPRSNRLFLAGNVLGMYFFGYGNFISSSGTIGVSLNKHLNLQGGYQLSSHLAVKSTSSRIGLDLTQRGVVAGVQVSF